MAIIEIKEVINHPDGAVVIVPVDLSIPSFFVNKEDFGGQVPKAGECWRVPDADS